jgi:hypothetical protein
METEGSMSCSQKIMLNQIFTSWPGVDTVLPASHSRQNFYIGLGGDWYLLFDFVLVLTLFSLLPFLETIRLM